MKHFSEITRNLSRAISADTIVLIVSVLVTIIAPRFLGVTEYGYWQIYLFYGAYLQIAQLGWSDGLLVRHAGREVTDPGQAKWFTGQFVLQFVMVSGVAMLLGSGALLAPSYESRFIILALSINIVISNCRFMCLRLFQATRQMRLYSFNIALDRIIYGSLVISLLLLGAEHFEILIICSLSTRLIALVAAMIASRRFLTRHLQLNRQVLIEARANISSGLRTLLATYAGLFTIGIVRLVVERSWGVDAFANVSLALNVAGLVSLFVSGLSYALLPYVRRASADKRRLTYFPIRSLVSVLLTSTLLLYFPTLMLFEWWLPHYSLATTLLYLLFPIVVFEGRTALLTITYLRSARKETSLLLVNTGAVLFSAVVSILSANVFNDLTLTVSTILIAVSAKSVALELVLLKHLKMQDAYRGILEIVVVGTFLVLTAVTPTWSSALFVLVMLFYVFMLRKDLLAAISHVRQAL